MRPTSKVISFPLANFAHSCSSLAKALTVLTLENDSSATDDILAFSSYIVLVSALIFLLKTIAKIHTGIIAAKVTPVSVGDKYIVRHRTRIMNSTLLTNILTFVLKES